jgi:hypothetical protein
MNERALPDSAEGAASLLAMAKERAERDIAKGAEMMASAVICGLRDSKTGKTLDKAGLTFMMITPDCFDPRRGGQRSVAAMLRRTCMMADAVGFVFASEIWKLPRRDIMPVDFSEDPERQEAVRLQFEHRPSGQYFVEEALVIRDGDKASLGPWEREVLGGPSFLFTEKLRTAEQHGLAALAASAGPLLPAERSARLMAAAANLARLFPDERRNLIAELMVFLRGALEERGVTFE